MGSLCKGNQKRTIQVKVIFSCNRVKIRVKSVHSETLRLIASAKNEYYANLNNN